MMRHPVQDYIMLVEQWVMAGAAGFIGTRFSSVSEGARVAPI